MALMTVKSFLDKEFKGEKPTTKWVREQIDAGQIPGRRIGKLYFVDYDKFKASTGSALADKVLNG